MTAKLTILFPECWHKVWVLTSLSYNIFQSWFKILRPAFWHHLPGTKDHCLPKIPIFWRTFRTGGWQIPGRTSIHASCSSHLSVGMFWGWSQLLAGTRSFRHSKARADWEAQPFPSPLYGTDFRKEDNPARGGYTDNTQQAWWRHALLKSPYTA